MRKLFIKLQSSRTASAVLISVAVFVFVLAAGILAINANRHVRFYMNGAQEMTVEYGREFDDPGTRAASIGALGGELPLKVACQGKVDTGHIGSYKLTYKVRYMSQDYTTERVVNVVDTTPPEIRLNHDSSYTPSWFEGYVEEGYTAFDAHDGDLTDKVTVEHDGLNLVYSVSDSAGNRAETVREIEYSAAIPHLELNGAASVIINARPYYADPGVKAYDENGNDLSQYVKVESSLNSAVPGDYSVNYSITNVLGDSISAERHVTVSGQAVPEMVRPEKTIYLTFDDGPGPYTGELLDVLDKYGAKATFFVTGNRPAYRDQITRAYNSGHSIGVHTYSHDYGNIYSSEEAFFNDFNATEEMIYELTGSYTQLCRFPGGSSNTVSSFNHGIMTRLTEALNSMSYKYFDWNVTSGDAGETTRTETVADNIISGCTGKNSAIVLQHDIKGFSVDAVEQVLNWGIENGYSFKALDLTSPDMHHGIAN